MHWIPPRKFASSLSHFFPVSILASLTFENQVAEMKTDHITSTCRNSPLSGHQKVQYTDQYRCRCVLKKSVIYQLFQIPRIASSCRNSRLSKLTDVWNTIEPEDVDESG